MFFASAIGEGLIEYIIPILNQSAIFVGSVVGLLSFESEMVSLLKKRIKVF